ncbi:uncharacterized protein LOC117135260 [Drosophila mauritiana]|uniref:Uncharacterized protein n=2 Tax=melanogaster subgroup TaxID=32351 RepID=A0A0J9R2Z2_DROSI|nr:uncharacterized protein LOC117135260 [Drosophila mauritiana]KMY90642.1 uncharacterized protein Dsimw501_GD28070 [Drosophila simulans]
MWNGKLRCLAARVSSTLKNYLRTGPGGGPGAFQLQLFPETGKSRQTHMLGTYII